MEDNDEQRALEILTKLLKSHRPPSFVTIENSEGTSFKDVHGEGMTFGHIEDSPNVEVEGAEMVIDGEEWLKAKNELIQMRDLIEEGVETNDEEIAESLERFNTAINAGEHLVKVASLLGIEHLL